MNDGHQDWPIYAIAAALIVGMVLWLAGAASAALDGHRIPKHSQLAGLRAFGHFGDPSRAWHGPVGGPILYWSVTFLVLSLFGLLVWGGWRLGTRDCRKERSDQPEHIEGFAERREIQKAASGKALLRRAGTLRPSLRRPRPSDVGVRLGRSRGIDCWASVEDSITVLGPPRQGKGLNIVIPAILDYPGAVITTSTRADNLTVTMSARSKVGPVAVFDPQGLAAGVPSALRWSPVRGCQRAQTAMIRAAAFTAGTGENMTDGNYWEKTTFRGVFCLLHAAALGGRGADSLYEWSLSAPGAKEAVQILMNHPQAASKWAIALDSIISAEPRRRDEIWSMVSNAFSALADPKVLEAVSPGEGEQFHPARFLRQKGTLYLLGTAGSKEVTGTAGLVSALIEDVVDTARRLASASPGARLDPPLGLILDEAANYPLPSLGALASEGGGTGITTLTVFQSLGQVRHKWGRDEAQALWDSSIVKVVLGGSSNADDLADISRMIGDRDTTERSQSWGDGRGISYSQSQRQRPILDPAAIRQLDFGYALLMMRSAKPIMLSLDPWTSRPDAGQINSDRPSIERAIRATAAAEFDEPDDGRAGVGVPA